MNYIVVPFLLAACVPPYIHLPPMYLKSTFNAHVNSELAIVNGNITYHILNNFTSQLICNAMADERLSCYIRNPNLIVTKTIMSNSKPVELLEETTDHMPFNFKNSILIEFIFDTIGIVDYRILRDDHPSKEFVDLFLTITRQMNIGNICLEVMRPTRNSNKNYIGRCITNYTVDHRFENLNLTIPKYKFNLKSISNFEIKDTKVKLIEKQRYIELCDFFNYDLFGIKHMKTSLPVHHRIKESTSRMKISIQDFVSTTENRYKLYNQDEQEVGNATEHIYLELDSI